MGRLSWIIGVGTRVITGSLPVQDGGRESVSAMDKMVSCSSSPFSVPQCDGMQREAFCEIIRFG